MNLYICFDPIFGGGGDMPKIQAQNPSRRAEPIIDVSEGTERQKKLAASLMTQNWDEPILGKKGLTGL